MGLPAVIAGGTALLAAERKLSKDYEKKSKEERAKRKEERSGESGDPRSRGRRKPAEGINRDRDIAQKLLSETFSTDPQLPRSSRGEPLSLADVKLANRLNKMRREGGVGNLRAKSVEKTLDDRDAKEYIEGMKKGGSVKKSRDGIAQRGKTKGRMC